MRRLTLPLCLLVLGACGQTRANTQIVASIDADPGVRSRAETLRVIVYGPPYDERGLPITMVRDTPFDMDTYAWPVVVALAPEGRDATRRYRIEAIAQDASGQPVAAVRAISGYVPDQTLTLPLRLLDRCIGVTCEDPGQTCFGPDDCRDATIDPQTLVDAGVDDMDGGTDVCVDAMCDGGIDGGVDAGAIDAGSDAGSIDAGFDAGHDAGHDAGSDAGHDAGYDAGSDAGIDAGSDAGIDAGYDAGFDAGRDSGAEAGVDSGSPPRLDGSASIDFEGGVGVP